MADDKPRRRKRLAPTREDAIAEVSESGGPKTIPIEPNEHGQVGKAMIDRAVKGQQQMRGPWPGDWYNQIRDKVAAKRAQAGHSPTDESAPKGRFGTLGGDTKCDNRNCERRRLHDGQVAWVFTADYDGAGRQYRNGAALCMKCASGVHKQMAIRAERHQKKLAERYGEREARRMTIGTQMQVGDRPGVYSRMG